MASAVRAGKSSHPTIAKAFSEQTYWQRYGIHVDPRPLRDRPWREIEEYRVLTEYLIAHEQAEAAKAARAARGR